MLNFTGMKRKDINTIVLFTLLLTGIISCEKNKTNPTSATDTVKKLLELEARTNALNSGMGKMTNFMSVIGYSQFKDGNLNIRGTGSVPASGDSIYYDSTTYWAPVTCAKVSEIVNTDSTQTTIYDYGDGCDEYGSFTKGKIIYIWKNDNSKYTSEVVYEHYYSYGVEMNGSSRYSFTSNGNSYAIMGTVVTSGDSTAPVMPVAFNWSGTSDAHEEISMNFDDGTSAYYKADFSNVWDSASYKVLQGEYYYKNSSEGYAYHYLVSEPLITDYTCSESWVPVSGIETITTTQNDGTTQEYSLNYGNGSCDNLAELSENGQTTVIDFGQLYKVMEGGKGVVVPMTANKRFK
jgi:hypothetical protein